MLEGCLAEVSVSPVLDLYLKFTGSIRSQSQIGEITAEPLRNRRAVFKDGLLTGSSIQRGCSVLSSELRQLTETQFCRRNRNSETRA